MPSGGPVGEPNELATILYYASRGFTPEAIQYFLRKKTGRDHIWIQAIIDTMERFSAKGGLNGKPQIFDSRTRMWHLDGVDNKIKELLSPYVDKNKDYIERITKLTPEDDSAVLTGDDGAYFNAPATQRQYTQSELGSTP